VQTSRNGSSPATVLVWTSWHPVQPLPVLAASPSDMKKLLYSPVMAKLNLPVAIWGNRPPPVAVAPVANLAWGLFKNWLPCGWLRKVIVLWY
jgi:hypothetical protein